MPGTCSARLVQHSHLALEKSNVQGMMPGLAACWAPGSLMLACISKFEAMPKYARV